MREDLGVELGYVTGKAVAQDSMHYSIVHKVHP